MLLKLGVRRENVWLCDLAGLVHEGREAEIAELTERRAIEGALLAETLAVSTQQAAEIAELRQRVQVLEEIIRAVRD